MFGLFRSGRHIVRLIGIALTLARHDALFPFERLGAGGPLLRAIRLVRRREREAGRPGERLAAAFSELGPSFIKLGQLLATRADLLGDDITEDLALLQDRLPPFPGTQARALIEAEFEQPVAAMIAAAGLDRASFRNLTGGIAALHSAWRL